MTPEQLLNRINSKLDEVRADAALLAGMLNLPKKPKKEKPQPSPQAMGLVRWFWSLLPNQARSTDVTKWGIAFDTLLKTHAEEEIQRVCVWARNDQFWSANFFSPAKLLKTDGNGTTYWVRFEQGMKFHRERHRAQQG